MESECPLPWPISQAHRPLTVPTGSLTPSTGPAQPTTSTGHFHWTSTGLRMVVYPLVDNISCPKKWCETDDVIFKIESLVSHVL
jgi:hypothetical protein